MRLSSVALKNCPLCMRDKSLSTAVNKPWRCFLLFRPYFPSFSAFLFFLCRKALAGPWKCLSAGRGKLSWRRMDGFFCMRCKFSIQQRWWSHGVLRLRCCPYAVQPRCFAVVNHGKKNVTEVDFFFLCVVIDFFNVIQLVCCTLRSSTRKTSWWRINWAPGGNTMMSDGK